MISFFLHFLGYWVVQGDGRERRQLCDGIDALRGVLIVLLAFAINVSVPD